MVGQQEATLRGFERKGVGMLWLCVRLFLSER